MDIEFLEDCIEKCDYAMKQLQSLDLFNYDTARKRNLNQRLINNNYGAIYDLKKNLRLYKLKIEADEKRRNYIDERN